MQRSCPSAVDSSRKLFRAQKAQFNNFPERTSRENLRCLSQFRVQITLVSLSTLDQDNRLHLNHRPDQRIPKISHVLLSLNFSRKFTFVEEKGQQSFRIISLIP